MSQPIAPVATRSGSTTLDFHSTKDWPQLAASKHQSTASKVSGVRNAASPPKQSTMPDRTPVHLLDELKQSSSSGRSSQDVRRYAEELRLQSESSATNGSINWETSSHSIEELTETSLPRRYEHSGQFEWIGNASGALPKYLWDSETKRTVLADGTNRELFEKGYIAVSWTWGRFQRDIGRGRKETRGSRGTKWNIPRIWHSSRAWSRDLVHELKQCLVKMPNRYFWVDVLCINQEDEDEKAAEIAKQAQIFRMAKGVLCYLWNLDNEQDLVLPLEGLGKLLQWTLVFNNNSAISRDGEPNTHVFDDNALRPYVEAFDRLRRDRWFESLWALQEIVLAPAGIWMTRSGNLAKVNNGWLTTRRLAMIIRILSWAERRTSQLWTEAEKHVRLKYHWTVARYNNQAARFESQRAQIESKVNCDDEKTKAHESRLRTKYLPLPASASSPSSSLYRSVDNLQPEIVLDDVDLRRTPWTIIRYAQEAPLREAIGEWTRWSFGTACIDISLSATRAGILIAGMNRKVVPGERREPALLAALKIEPDLRLSKRRRETSPRAQAPQARPRATRTGNYQSSNKHISPLLMNVMLKGAGLGLFNVEHHVFGHDSERDALETVPVVQISSIRSEPSYDMVNVQRYPVRRSQHRRAKSPKLEGEEMSGTTELPILQTSALTNMFPATACNLNTLALDFEAMYDWLGHDQWHLHDGGVVHIPHDVAHHVIPQSAWKQAFDLRIRSNGDDYKEYCVQNYQQLKALTKRNEMTKIMQVLKEEGVNDDQPPFLFIPFGKRKKGFEAQDSFKNTHSAIGVVLIGGSKVGAHESLTRWYKFGNYLLTGIPESRLKAKEGLIVVSYEDRNEFPVRLGMCEELKTSANQYLYSHTRVMSADMDYVKVEHTDIIHANRQHTTHSISSSDSRRRWSLRETLKR